MSHRPGNLPPRRQRNPIMPCTAPAGAGINTSQVRALHALVLEDHPHPAGSGPLRRGLFVDCETTGFSAELDTLIELAMLPFDYTIDGHITHVHRDQARPRLAPGPGLAGPARDHAHHGPHRRGPRRPGDRCRRRHRTPRRIAPGRRAQRALRSSVPRSRPPGRPRRRLGVLPARGQLGPRRVPFEVPRVPPVRVRRLLAGPPPRAR